jgi:hypothetical protein
MTLSDYRKRLMSALQTESARLAIENGSSHARDLSEYRLHAGRVLGLQQAIAIIEDFGRDDEDEDA